MDEFVLPLLIDLELEQDCFFIVPGNHEIDLTKINDIYDNGLKDRLKDYNGVIPVKYKDEYILKERLEGFRAFERELIGCSSEEIVSVRQKVINDKKVGFCLINTSWNLSSSGLEDKGRVIIGKSNLFAGLQKIKNCDYKICLMHHSFSWLRDEDSIDIEPLLGQFDLVLYGHSHYATQKQVVSPNGKSVYCMASESLPLTSKTGYNIIRFDENLCTILQRSYFVHRNEFDADLNIEGGKQVFIIGEQDDKALVFNSCVHTRKGFFDKLNTISMTSLIHDGKQTFDEYYVVPKLSCFTEASINGVAKKEKQKNIAPTEIVESEENFVIYGQKDYGKTLLLYYLAEQYYLDIYNKKLPIIIDCQNIKANENSILKEIRGYLLNLSDDNFKISIDEIVKILSSGNCVLLFDNFSPTNSNVNVVADFIKKYSENKRIFTILQTPSSILENKIADEIGEEDEKYRRVYMKYMSKNDIRKMANTLSSCETDLNTFTNRIVSCFDKTYIPRTPFAVALVVEICNANADYEPVNLSAVVRRYMEIVLDRLSPRELLLNEYTFEIKEDFLAHMAYNMVKSNCFEVNVDVFNKWVIEYHEQNGFSVSETRFDECFFACPIFVKQNNKVSFKYACLLEYYIGKYASLDEDFLDGILSKDKFINYTSELIYCAGIDTRNTKIIDKLSQYVKESIDEERIDTSFLSGDRIKLDISVTDDEVQAKIIDKQLSEQEIDRVTDIEDNSAEYLPANINKAETYDISKNELDYFDILLSTYGDCLRNLELIGYKNRYTSFNQYMEGSIYWCSVLAESVEEFIKTIRKEIADNENIDSNRVEEEIRDFCRIMIPCLAEYRLFEALGTKKLGKIFSDYYNSNPDYTSLHKFLVLLVSLEVKASNWKEMFEDFLNKCKSKDLRIVLFVKMIYLYKFCHFGKKNNNYLADKLYELSRSINKKVGALNGANKTKFINDINQEQRMSMADDS